MPKAINSYKCLECGRVYEYVKDAEYCERSHVDFAKWGVKYVYEAGSAWPFVKEEE